MAIAGLLNTTAFDTPSGRRPQNFREGILRLYPRGGMQKGLLMALTAVMKTKPTDDPVFHWFTKQMNDRRLLLAANINNTDVAGASRVLTVDADYGGGAQSLKQGDRVLVEQTGEIAYVSVTPTSATALTVIRGFSETAGSALTAVAYAGAGVNPYLKVIGSAYEEGSFAPDPVSFSPVELFNQTQIFRQTYGLTNTAKATETRTGPEEAELKREALELFGMDMEMAAWFSRKATSILNGKPLRQTNGIISYIPAANRFVPEDGILTPDVLDSWSEQAFRYGSEEKMAFCGNTFLTAVSRMVRKSGEAKYELSDTVSEYGIGGIRRLRTPNGTIVLKNHPLFSQMTGGKTAGTEFTSMSGAAVVLDMANLTYRPLRGRDVQFQPNLQAIGEDSTKAGWLAEAGFEVHFPETHFMISGVKTGRDDIVTTG